MADDADLLRARAPTTPGALVDALTEFSAASVNLTRIESRPLRRGLGRYMFFVDLEGADSRPDVAEAIEALRDKAENVRVLGSYPVERGPASLTPGRIRRAMKRVPSGRSNGVPNNVVSTAPADARSGRRHGRPRGRVLVLNASYEPINVCTMRRATVLVLKERAEVLEERGEGDSTPSGS